MDDPSIRRDRGVSLSFGVALAYFLTGVCAVLMPPELQGRPEITPHQFWTVLSQHPTAHLCFHWAWVLAGLCGIAAVPSISLLVWSAHRGAALWSGLAALLGFAVMARSHLMEVAWDRKIIPVYQTADPAFQQAVHVVAGLALDVPDGVLTYGAVGIWVAVISVLSGRQQTQPALVRLSRLRYRGRSLRWRGRIRPAPASLRRHRCRRGWLRVGSRLVRLAGLLLLRRPAA